MTIEYRGRNLKEDRKIPEAWIFYDEEIESEEEKSNKLAEILESEGWECACEYGWITIPLDLGKIQYYDLVSDYKDAKKAVGAR